MYPKRYNHFMGCKTTILAPTPVHDFLHLLDLLSTSSSSSSSSSAIKKIHDGSVPVSGFSPSATVVFRLPSAKLFSWHRPPVDAAPRSRASIIPFPRGGGCEIYYDPPRPRPRLVIVRTVRTYGAVRMCSSSSRTRVQTTKEEKRDRLPPPPSNERVFDRAVFFLRSSFHARFFGFRSSWMLFREYCFILYF